jgi:hypothetical protein
MMNVTDKDFLHPTFVHMLKSLSNWLDKAAAQIAAQSGKPDVSLTWCLAPDMYPLAGQVRFACYLAQEPIYRLQGMQPPANLLDVRAAGWASRERPGEMSVALDLLAGTIELLNRHDYSALAASAERSLTLELPDGHVFDLNGAQYLRDWALPQFYFHVNTAYAILRNGGIDLGKADYIPHMFGYLRAPQSGSKPG